MLDGAVLGDELFVLRFLTASAEDERLLCVNLGIDVDAGSFAESLVAPPDDHTWAVRWSSAEPDYGGYGTPPVVTDRGWRLPSHSAIVLKPVPAKRNA